MLDTKLKPLHALLISLMLICVALVSYDGGKRQVRREMIGVEMVSDYSDAGISNLGPNKFVRSTNEAILNEVELISVEMVYTNKAGGTRSVITSDKGTSIRTNKLSAPTGLRVVVDDIAQLQKQIGASQEERRKLSFEAGYWKGRLKLVRYLRTNGVSWPIELSMKIINAETNELKVAWDEFNK